MKNGLGRGNGSRGVTMIELLFAVAIVSILSIVAIRPMQRQMVKGRDAKRKGDLVRLKKTMEEYYNENEQYPKGLGAVLCKQAFGGGKYKMPCDPINRTPYRYTYEVPTDGSSYKVIVLLENTSDPDIAKVGCASGCGAGNWGVTSSNTGLP